MPSSTHKLTCRNGHTFSLPAHLEDENVVPCPACTVGVIVTKKPFKPTTSSDSAPVIPVVTTPASESASGESPRGRGLWALMQQQESGPQATPVGSTLSGANIDQSAVTHPKRERGADEQAAAKGRGLWALMGAPKAGAGAEPQTKAEPPTEAFVRKPTTAIERGLGELKPLPFFSRSIPAAKATEDDDAADDEDAHEIDDAESQPAQPTGLLSPAEHAASLNYRELVTRRSRWALGFGVAAVLLAPLNLLPWMVAKVPGAIVGLIAVFKGHQAATDSRRCPERTRLMVFSITGLCLGLTGLVSGPLGLNDLSSQWQQAALQRGVSERLQGIGTGIVKYHNEYDHFPMGGTVARDAEGNEIGMHGWMTHLLPYFGHEELYQRLDLKQPYDHGNNREAMQQVIPQFLAPNVPHQPTKQGYATTHFAGLGGQSNGPNGVMNFGIFDRNVTVRRTDVVDGLAQTMIVGEIALQLPAWGDPENWREIDQGLNRQSQGFGNKDGTGAHFLFADGSVRFFSNQTSREVLEKLSTRDGRD